MKLQSYDIKLALARVLYDLVEFDDKRKLKSSGFLTQNSLCKERKSEYNIIYFYYFEIINRVLNNCISL